MNDELLHHLKGCEVPRRRELQHLLLQRRRRAAGAAGAVRDGAGGRGTGGDAHQVFAEAQQQFEASEAALQEASGGAGEGGEGEQRDLTINSDASDAARQQREQDAETSALSGATAAGAEAALEAARGAVAEVQSAIDAETWPRTWFKGPEFQKASDDEYGKYGTRHAAIMMRVATVDDAAAIKPNRFKPKKGKKKGGGKKKGAGQRRYEERGMDTGGDGRRKNRRNRRSKRGSQNDMEEDDMDDEVRQWERGGGGRMWLEFVWIDADGRGWTWMDVDLCGWVLCVSTGEEE